ncbi:MAG TPA: GNAT family N-acetyltransferase [Gaiellaceae bacterium]|jgi:GNAT superfamily N-acetyltransferase|nr:GNAT family N-acetyltransferase [Gaiellaceae bacterium]
MTLAELAEDTAVHLLPRPGFEMLDRPGFVYEASANRAGIYRVRLGDVAEAVAWSRAETRRRGIAELEWWVGWHAEPHDLTEQLLALGLTPADPPVLTGMTSAVEPPRAEGVEIRRITTIEEQLAALRIDWEVWGVPPDEWERRTEGERKRFDPDGPVQHFGAYLDGEPVGFGRGIDMREGVALMGGVVLPEARGRGVYRALVRARWEHAVTRGTPLLVVQAGEMSAPVLDGLGFVRHGDLRLFTDPGVAS